jgi:hypothetical protein
MRWLYISDPRSHGSFVFECQGVLVLAATSRPQAIDAALMRPGRFDSVSGQMHATVILIPVVQKHAMGYVSVV